MKTIRLVIVLAVFLVMFAGYALAGYCTLGTIGDLATTDLGQWPYVKPMLDTQRFRANLTIVLATMFAMETAFLAYGCHKLGKWGARYV